MYALLQALVFHREIASTLNLPPCSVNLSASFLENGGSSLSLIKLLHVFRRNDIPLQLDVVYSVNTLAQLLHHAISRISSPVNTYFNGTKRKNPTLVEDLRKHRRISGQVEGTEVIKKPKLRPVHCEMTCMQLTFLHASIDGPGVNVIHYHETHCPENIVALKLAWRAVTESEPILRSTYRFHDTGVYLVEQDNPCFHWEETIVQDEQSYTRHIDEANVRTSYFGSSFRVVTLQSNCSGVSKSRVVWRVHHALVDGYSHLILLAKIRNYLAGKEIQPGIPFSQYVVGLQAIRDRFEDTGKTFWKNQRKEHPNSISQLPFPPPLANSLDTKGHLENQVVEVEVDTQQLLKDCVNLGVTLPALFYTAWALTLTAYTGANDVCFGAVLCGRTLPIPDVTSVVGPTINMLPVNLRIRRDTTFEQQLRYVFEQILALTSHEWTSPKDGYTCDFHTAVNVQVQLEEISEPVFEMLEPAFSTIRSEIPLQVEVLQEGRIRLQFDPSRYSLSQIRGLGRAYARAIDFVRTPSCKVKTCLDRLLDRKELSSLGNWTASGTRTGSIEDDVVSLFTRVAKEHPTAIAMERGSRSLTYSELNFRSSAVHRGIAHFVTPGSVVGVHADGSMDWIIAMYAILKAGAVYCPFDEQSPIAIRDQNFATSKAELFLVGCDADKSTKPGSCNLCLSVEELLQIMPGPLDEADCGSIVPQPDSDMYLCFTSGSSGKAKGVLCQHRGLVAFQGDFDVRLRARLGWKVAQFMSPAFDGSIHEIFSALSYGATLVLKDRSKPLDHLKKADAAILTPSVAKALDVDDFPRLKVVYLVGEAVTPDVADVWASKKTLFNMYGPTEATCGATIKHLIPGQMVSLGVPNPSTRIYILGPDAGLLPRGVVGEIYLAGVQVANGYIDRHQETAKRFLPDSINAEFGETMYRTGDRGYWHDNGELMFLGRSDRQLKLRGFRIDMDDLEVQMCQAASGVTSVAVTVVDDDLVAQIQPADLDLAKFKEEIHRRIPAYAVPRRIIPVEAFPMTIVGKLNYTKIGQDVRATTTSCEGRDAATLGLEQIFTTTIQNALGPLNQALIQPCTNFIELGCNSLVLLSLSRSISRPLKRNISVQVLLRYPTARRLAQFLASPCIDSLVKGNDVVLLGDDGVSPIELDWWNKHHGASETSGFNVNFVCELGPTVQLSKLVSAWNQVLKRHRILSCTYQGTLKRDVRRTYNRQPPKVKVVQSLDIDHEIHALFHLQRGNLIRVTISPTHMVVVVSHIICDLTTLNILLKEVSTIYNGRSLVPIGREYSQTCWSTIVPNSNLSFWSEYLKDARGPTYLYDKLTRRSTWSGTSRIFMIQQSTYERMKTFTITQKVTMHQLALASVALALTHQDNDCDITIGAPYLNRNTEVDQGVVGLFLEPLPIRVRYPLPEMQDSFIHAVQRSSRSALSHAVPFHRLLSHMSITPDYPSHPLFDVMVTFHEPSQRLVFDMEDTKPLDLWTRGAKFKLMAEFSAKDKGGLALRLEYSTECFETKDIFSIGASVERALEALSDGRGFEEARDSVR